MPGTEHVLVQVDGEHTFVQGDSLGDRPLAEFLGTGCDRVSRRATRGPISATARCTSPRSSGSGERTLASGVLPPASDVTGPVWSPDGSRHRGGLRNGAPARPDQRLRTEDAAGGAECERQPELVPDSTTVAFEHDTGTHWQIWVTTPSCSSCSRAVAAGEAAATPNTRRFRTRSRSSAIASTRWAKQRRISTRCTRGTHRRRRAQARQRRRSVLAPALVPNRGAQIAVSAGRGVPASGHLRRAARRRLAARTGGRNVCRFTGRRRPTSSTARRTSTSSTGSAATTRSPATAGTTRSRATAATTRSTAARATTSSSPAPATIASSAAPATTRSSAATASTGSTAGPATTRSRRPGRSTSSLATASTSSGRKLVVWRGCCNPTDYRRLFSRKFARARRTPLSASAA